MNTTKNDITGDLIKSKTASSLYKDNYDKIIWSRNENDQQNTDNETSSIIQSSNDGKVDL